MPGDSVPYPRSILRHCDSFNGLYVVLMQTIPFLSGDSQHETNYRSLFSYSHHTTPTMSSSPPHGSPNTLYPDNSASRAVPAFFGPSCQVRDNYSAKNETIRSGSPLSSAPSSLLAQIMTIVTTEVISYHISTEVQPISFVLLLAGGVTLVCTRVVRRRI